MLKLWSGWPDVERQLGAPAGGDELALWRARRTVAATIARALANLPKSHLPRGRGAGNRWVVWLVGARDECEGELARRGWLAEVLAALCPAVPGFEIVLIGPEMKSDWELGSVRSIRGTLHERDVAGQPDVAVLVNSGIGTLLEPLVSCWLPTLAQLLALDVPLCLTCYHEGEAAGEEAVLRAFEAVPLGPSEVNPLAYVLPSRLGDDAAAEVAAAAARADRSRAARQARRAARQAAALRSDDERGAALAQASAEEFEAARLHGDATDAANSHLRWWCGSALSAAALRDEAVPRGRKLLRECAQVFLPTNLDAWLAALRGGDGVGLETRAAMASLLAEGTSEASCAHFAIRGGAREALTIAARAAAAAAAGAAPASTYVGEASVASRLAAAAANALANLEAAEAAVLALAAPADEAVEELAPPRRARVVFKGAYVHVRRAPSTAAEAIGQRTSGAELAADARQGPWLRLAGAGGWVLTRHPVYGALVEILDS